MRRRAIRWRACANDGWDIYVVDALATVQPMSACFIGEIMVAVHAGNPAEGFPEGKPDGNRIAACSPFAAPGIQISAQ
ncbi:hypothetical protein D3C76_1623830 [compost metagenome]